MFRSISHIAMLKSLKKLINSMYHWLSLYGKNILHFQLKIFWNTGRQAYLRPGRAGC
jgi:hypothetical protein